MKNTRQFIIENKITITTEWTDTNPNMDDVKWARTARHYKCVLKYQRRQITTYYSMGSAHTREPQAEDVLDSLASDAAGYANAIDFEDWARDYGYDTDSRKAERTFRIIGKQANKLRIFLGRELFDELLWETERL